MKNAIASSCLAALSAASFAAAAAAAPAPAPGFDPAVSARCTQFFNKASAAFTIKNIRRSPSSQGYASFEMGFAPAVADAIETDDYTMAFSCKKTTDPTWKSIPIEQLTATMDFNGATKFRDRISDLALGQFGKLVAYSGSLSDSEGRKRLAACFAAANKAPTRISPSTVRFDAAFEDGNGAEFSCFRISSARWSSYGLAVSNGFNFAKAALVK